MREFKVTEVLNKLNEVGVLCLKLTQKCAKKEGLILLNPQSLNK